MYEIIRKHSKSKTTASRISYAVHPDNHSGSTSKTGRNAPGGKGSGTKDRGQQHHDYMRVVDTVLGSHKIAEYVLLPS